MNLESWTLDPTINHSVTPPEGSEKTGELWTIRHPVTHEALEVPVYKIRRPSSTPVRRAVRDEDGKAILIKDRNGAPIKELKRPDWEDEKSWDSFEFVLQPLGNGQVEINRYFRPDPEEVLRMERRTRRDSLVEGLADVLDKRGLDLEQFGELLDGMIENQTKPKAKK